MTTGISRVLPPGAARGPMQGVEIIGEVTESLHRFIMDGWEFERAPPRIEEDLSFVPKDREEVLYVYMYKAAHNKALVNTKRFRDTNIRVSGDERVFYERAPLYLDLYYMISVHSKFRSDAERLLGYALLRLHEATHLVYRPRKYTLPGGQTVNSKGEPWSLDVDMNDEGIVFEKVSLALVDDLTIGDAINFFTIHEAPYRPYLTYCARCAMEGGLLAGEATTVRPGSAADIRPPGSDRERPRAGSCVRATSRRLPSSLPSAPRATTPARRATTPTTATPDDGDDPHGSWLPTETRSEEQVEHGIPHSRRLHPRSRLRREADRVRRHVHSRVPRNVQVRADDRRRGHQRQRRHP